MAEPANGLLKALFHMVWADDIVSPEEVEVLNVLLRKFGYPLSEIICILDKNLSEPPEDRSPVRLEELFESREDQKKALQALMQVCFSTGGIDPEQVGYIEGLVVRMGLSSQELEELRKQAMEEAQC